MTGAKGRISAAMSAALLLMASMTAGSGEAPPAAQVPVAATPVMRNETLEELDEVQVKGTKLWQMRERIVAAEERFFKLYNELNTEDDYDVNCAREAPLGTRLKSRICRVQYFEDAEAEYAQAMLTGGYAPNPQMVALERGDDYRKHALKVINSDPRLRKLIKEREELEQRYLKERKKRFKGRWIIFE